jgi:GMP synthase (glutamine-hydrolysing)
MKVHFVVHESYEGPGAFDAWVNERGYDASFSRVYLGQSVPATAEAIDLLVVLGGPQSPGTTLGECPIRLTAEGAADPRLAGFEPVLDVGHWHHDMPGLTAGAKVLASSGGCSRQIIQYGEFIYGFQCHPEFTRESVTAIIENSAGELVASCGRPHVQDAAEILGHAFEHMNAALFSFLDRLTADHATMPLRPPSHQAA